MKRIVYLDSSLRQPQPLAEFLPNEAIWVMKRMAYLNPGLRQSKSLTEFLPHEGVWVVRLLKQSLQLVELLQREVGSAASLFDLRRLLGIVVFVLIRVLRFRRDAALRVIV